MGSLEGRVALVTGAAQGQGRSHAVELAREGADVIALDVCEQLPGVPYPMGTEQKLQETVRAVATLGRRAVALKADVRDLDELQAAIEQGVDRLGGLDIVAANAGIVSKARRADVLDRETWQQMIDVNLTGVWQTCKVALPHLIAGGRGGSVVLTSSVAGLRGYASLAHYVSAKHGVVGLMRTLAVEFGPERIRVNSVHPTQVDTDMIMNEPTYRLFAPSAEHPTRSDLEAASEHLHALPVPWVEPVDVSRALVFLASDDARYITGVALPIDAGRLVV